MASPGRVPSPELNLRPSLNPAPVVNVAMVQPINRQGAGSNLMRIAESLAGLGGSIGQFGRSMPQDKKQGEDPFPKIAKPYSSAQTQSDPRFDPTNPVHVELLGYKQGVEFGNNLQTYVQKNYDPSKGSIDDFLAMTVKTQQDQLGVPEAQAGFGQGVAEAVGKTRDWYYKVQAENADATNKQNRWQLAYQEGIKFSKNNPDATPEQVAEAIQKGVIQPFIDSQFMAPKDANELLMNVASEYAKNGDKDMVRALVNMRRGKNGEIDPISMVKDLEGQVNTLMSEADKNWQTLHTNQVSDWKTKAEALEQSGTANDLIAWYNGPEGQKAVPDPISRAEQLRLAIKRQGDNAKKVQTTNSKEQLQTAAKADAVDDFRLGRGRQDYSTSEHAMPDGTTFRLDRKTEAQAAVDEYVASLYAEAGDDPEKRAAVDKTLARLYSQSGVQATEWQNIMDGVEQSMNSTAIAEGKIPKNVERAYELWSNTKDNPEVQDAKFGSSANKVDDLFTAVDIFRSKGMEFPVALQQAQQVFSGDRYQRAIGRVEEVAYGSGSSTLGFRDYYSVDTASKIAKRAYVYAASSNMTAAQAVEKATKDFEKLTVKIDVGPVSYIDLPRNNMTDAEKAQYGSTIETFIKDQVDMFGAQQEPPVNMEDVSIWEFAPGKFQLKVDGESIPVFMNHKGGAKGRGVEYFTYSDIQNYLSQKDKANKSAASAGAVDENNFRKSINKPIDPQGRSAGGVLLDNVKEFFTPKEDTSILKGLTGNAVDAYGAKNGDDLRKLSDARLFEITDMARKGTLKGSGFATPKMVQDVWSSRVFKKAREAGFTMKQVDAAMTRWNLTNELEAIDRLKQNKAQPNK